MFERSEEMASNLPAEVLPGRTAPHSAEAEMSVLGSMILD